MQDAQCVSQFEDIAECLDVTIAPTVLQIADIGRAVNRPKIHHIAADVQVSCGISSVQHELLRCVHPLRLDEIAAQADDLSLLIHQRPSATIHLARRGAANL